MLSEINKHERDKYISFKEEGHIYNVNGNTDYTSVTKIVKNLFEQFNPDKVIDNMMKSPKWSQNKYFGMEKWEIKKQWKESGIKAAREGTQMHLNIENYYNGVEENIDNIEYKYFNNFVKDNDNLIPYRSEWTVFDIDKKITGTIDMVFINEDNTLSIYDWKRSKDIVKTTNFNKYSKLKSIDHIPDTNYWHYSIQLNIYKYVIEKNYGFKVRDLYLVQIHPENNNYKKLKVPFLEEEIKNIIL